MSNRSKKATRELIWREVFAKTGNKEMSAVDFILDNAKDMVWEYSRDEEFLIKNLKNVVIEIIKHLKDVWRSMGNRVSTR